MSLTQRQTHCLFLLLKLRRSLSYYANAALICTILLLDTVSPSLIFLLHMSRLLVLLLCSVLNRFITLFRALSVLTAVTLCPLKNALKLIFGLLINEFSVRSLHEFIQCTNNFPTSIVLSDASQTGCAAITYSLPSNIPNIAYVPFSDSEMTTSSTHRELLAVLCALSLLPALRNRRSYWQTDNQAVPVIRRGSIKTDLNAIAVSFSVQARRLISLIKPQWIPRAFNEVADYYSKHKNCYDWKIDTTIFSQLFSRYGPFIIDLFANQLNAKVSRFFSKIWCPGVFAVMLFPSHGISKSLGPFVFFRKFPDFCVISSLAETLLF